MNTSSSKTKLTGGITAKEAAIGTGMAFAAGAVAAMAGSYFLYGTDAAKNRKKVSGWMLRAKGEVLEKLERAHHMNEAAYHQIIDAVSAKYAGLKNVDRSEINALVKDLKSHWKNIVRQIERGTRRKAHKSVKQ